MFYLGFCTLIIPLSDLLAHSNFFSVFIPFWIVGALVLVFPRLRRAPTGVPAAWMPHANSAERQEVLARTRKAELAWARKCAASLVLFFLAVTLGIVGVMVFSSMTEGHST